MVVCTCRRPIVDGKGRACVTQDNEFTLFITDARDIVIHAFLSCAFHKFALLLLPQLEHSWPETFSGTFTTQWSPCLCSCEHCFCLFNIQRHCFFWCTIYPTCCDPSVIQVAWFPCDDLLPVPKQCNSCHTPILVFCGPHQFFSRFSTEKSPRPSWIVRIFAPPHSRSNVISYEFFNDSLYPSQTLSACNQNTLDAVSQPPQRLPP